MSLEPSQLAPSAEPDWRFARASIQKHLWLTALECPAKAWHSLRTVSEAPTEAGRFRMQQGQEVGALARKLYPDGLFVFERDGKTPAEITQELIADPKQLIIFESTLLAPPFV